MLYCIIFEGMQNEGEGGQKLTGVRSGGGFDELRVDGGPGAAAD